MPPLPQNIGRYMRSKNSIKNRFILNDIKTLKDLASMTPDGLALYSVRAFSLSSQAFTR